MQRRSHAHESTAEISDPTGTNPTPKNISATWNIVDINDIDSVDIKGRFLGIGFATDNSPTTNETAAMAWSCDGGVTWECRSSSNGTVDVAEPSCAVSLNGDFNLIYLEAASSSQSYTTVVAGIKVPTLVNDTSAAQGIKVTSITYNLAPGVEPPAPQPVKDAEYRELPAGDEEVRDE